MNEEERRRSLPLCSFHPDLLPGEGKQQVTRVKLSPWTGRIMKAWFDPNPPPRTERPWVDDPRFGLL